MPGRAETLLQRIVTKARRGHCGDPVGTVAFYGPDDKRAVKVVVGISPDPQRGITETRKWWNVERDVREDAKLLEEVLAFLSSQNVKSLIMTNGVYGCPHEAGIDYPDGESCAQCSFWQDHDRDVGLIGLDHRQR
ncbi:MAG: hypothetical protein ABW321_13485 [Polyangiales bacterium]